MTATHLQASLFVVWRARKLNSRATGVYAEQRALLTRRLLTSQQNGGRLTQAERLISMFVCVLVCSF